jgi:hypothetical protein
VVVKLDESPTFYFFETKYVIYLETAVSKYEMLSDLTVVVFFGLISLAIYKSCKRLVVVIQNVISCSRIHVGLKMDE